jgi:hypothetical protein
MVQEADGEVWGNNFYMPVVLWENLIAPGDSGFSRDFDRTESDGAKFNVPKVIIPRLVNVFMTLNIIITETQSNSSSGSFGLTHCYWRQKEIKKF